MMKRKSVSASVSVLFLLLIYAAAATAEIRIRIIEELVTAESYVAPELDVYGSDDDDRIDLDFAQSGVTISAREHVLLDRRRFCRRLSSREIRCGFDIDVYNVSGALGDDHIQLDGRVSSQDVSASGGEGGDVIVGGASGESLYGNGGDDLVIGGGGDDWLVGDDLGFRPDPPGSDVLRGGPGDDFLGNGLEAGADEFRGGPGDDDIYTVDKGTAEAIDGGPGSDICRVEPRDPHPRRCEEVRIGPPS